MPQSVYPFSATALFLLAIHSSSAVAAMTPPSPPPLPAPTGHVVSVSTVSQLQAAVGALAGC
jgi:hypothetical protein